MPLKNANSPKVVIEHCVRLWLAAGSPGRCPNGGDNIPAVTAFLEAMADDFREAGDEQQAKFWDAVVIIWPRLARRARPESELPSRARH